MAYKRDYKKKEDVELSDPRIEQTQKVVERMKQARDNGERYKRGWFVATSFPYNPITGKDYSGVNIVTLGSEQFDDARFFPAGELAKLYKETDGAVRIKKGEKACRIVFSKTRTVGTGEVDSDTGEEKTKSFPVLKFHPVFNASQLEGLDIINERFPLKERKVMNQLEENEFVKAVVEGMKKTGLTFDHHAAGQAYYQPGLDAIKLPEMHRFASEQHYNRTVLHEIGHATGHPSRCDRPMGGMKGSPDYAYEELVAELFSYFMSMHTGIDYDPSTHENHATYLNSWIDAMTKDTNEAKNYIFSAASKAFKAYDFVMEKCLGLENKKEATEENTKTTELRRVPTASETKPVIETRENVVTKPKKQATLSL